MTTVATTTFDRTTYADVQEFWAQVIAWAKPQAFCAEPQ